MSLPALGFRAVIVWFVVSQQARAEDHPSPVGPAAEPGQTVQLKVATQDTGVTVERLMADGTSRSVCVAPCDEWVPRRDIYVVAEDGSPGSPPFSLRETNGPVTLTVHRGSSALRTAGLILGGVGFAAQFTGFVLAGGDPAPGRESEASRLRGAGLVAGLSGLVVAGLGVFLYLRGQGHVAVSTGNSFNLSH